MFDTIEDVMQRQRELLEAEGVPLVVYDGMEREQKIDFLRLHLTREQLTRVWAGSLAAMEQFIAEDEAEDEE